MFESYLRQRGISFKYEPFGDANKNPDYLVRANGKKILFEVKEIEKLPFDIASEGSLKTGKAFGLNPVVEYNLLRRRIDTASKQLKPYTDQVDYSIIILGKKDGFGIDIDALFYAMFGDPYISIPIDPSTGGGSMEKSTLEMKVTGSFRKNRPQTKMMYSLHNYVSAVGLIKSFSARSYYQQKIIERYTKSKKYEAMTPEEGYHYLCEMTAKHENLVPGVYSDPSKVLYKLELVTNPLGEKPLPEKLFYSKWDYIRVPKVIEQII